jgi:hypothetical protein
MPSGGARQGAGRKKGSQSAKTLKRAEIARKALDNGLTPLDYMLSILRDETQDQAARIEVAKAAAPYVHPKLANIEHTGKDGAPLLDGISVVFVNAG